MLSRILFGIIIVASAFVFQWWIGVLLSVFGLFYFSNLYEVIAVGIIIDSLYGVGPAWLSFLNFDFPFTILMIVLLLLTTKLKQQLLITK